MGKTEKSNVLLKINDLKTYFFLERGTVKAVDGVSFEVKKGETLGIVGESGSGKTVTGLSILGLVPSPPGKIVGGQIIFNGEDLLKKSEEEIRAIRGGSISMVFQDPTAALNPVYTVGFQIAESLERHQGLNNKEAIKGATEMLSLVGIPSPDERINDYPHQLSGGMKQRVMIAMALSCNPSLLIADEPTSNLDVTIQAQILKLMQSLRKQFGSSVILITHHLGVVAEMADKVAVMYAGEMVEYADTVSLFYDTKHPYTKGLMKCIPRVDAAGEKLQQIKGSVPDLTAPPSGCKFHPRCPSVFQRCKVEKPELQEVAPGHLTSCHLYD